MSLKDERREYRYGKLDRAGLHESPFAQFDIWMQQAQTAGLSDVTAMVLATVDAAGQPRQRTVLLKEISQHGLTFFYESGKHQGPRDGNECSGQRAVSLAGVGSPGQCYGFRDFSAGCRCASLF